jgi:hypothetical protein
MDKKDEKKDKKKIDKKLLEEVKCIKEKQIAKNEIITK